MGSADRPTATPCEAIEVEDETPPAAFAALVGQTGATLVPGRRARVVVMAGSELELSFVAGKKMFWAAINSQSVIFRVRSSIVAVMEPQRDIVSKAKRSEMMRAVGQRGTSAERAVQAILRELGAHYRLNHPGLPGRPDFANRTRGWAVFVHGCFWHGHRNCRKTKGGKSGRVPATNAEFWAQKIEGNRERDARKEQALRDLGLRVLTVWECELREPEKVRRKLMLFLDLHQ
jgi:DNA mismatch endonuclease (patch repair protein)